MFPTLTLTARKHPARRQRPRLRPPALEPLESRTLLSSTLIAQTNLISNGAVPAVQLPDPQLVNPWGISFGPNTPFWVSDNGMSVATIYDAAGAKQGLVVQIPGAGGQDASPTGQIFNATPDFLLTSGTTSVAATFIFAGEDGGISAWAPKINPTHAVLTVDHSFDGAVFKGLTADAVAGHNYLLASDFHNARIDVFDAAFHQTSLAGNFTDPNLPMGFAPFNVQNIGGKIYVTYAKQDADAHDDVAGNANGYVDVYNPNGTLAMRLQHGGFLNSPWGLALAPASWGRFAGDLLVGNFGSGQIAAFNPTTGHFEGHLRGTDHKRLTIDGLWALTFGNGARAGDANTLYFTAGLNHEADGLFGSLSAVVTANNGHHNSNPHASPHATLHR